MDRRRFFSLIKYYFKKEKRREDRFLAKKLYYSELEYESLDYVVSRLRAKYSWHENISKMFKWIVGILVALGIFTITFKIAIAFSKTLPQYKSATPDQLRLAMICVICLGIVGVAVLLIGYIWYSKYVSNLKIEKEMAEKLLKQREDSGEE